MKMPEGIKKGLEHCGEDGCKDCPYVEDCTMTDGFSELAKDSLEYIQQLELDKQQLEGLYSHMNQLRDAAAGRALKMEAEIDRQRERIRVLELSLQAVNDGNADLQRENLMLEAQVPRWISVEERLPEEGELVLFIPTINQGSVYVGKLSHTGARGGVLFENRQGRTTMKYYAKYWMPLPEPPEVNEK